MNLWIDLASGAARGLQPYLRVAGAIADRYIAWVTSRLQAERPGEESASAALFLTAIQGMHILEAIGRPSIAAKGGTQVVANFRRSI